MHNEPNTSIEQRIVQLEERIAWYEAERAELDGVVRELFERVQSLERLVATSSPTQSTPDSA